MNATAKEIKLLKELETIDKKIEDNVEKYNELSQLNSINKIRAKKAEVKTKLKQVETIYVKTRKELKEIEELDSKLAVQQKEMQNKIDELGGDYRKVESHTLKLNEITNRRKNVDKRLETLEDNFNKISSIKRKIDDAIGKISMQEDDLKNKQIKELSTLQYNLEQIKNKKKSIEEQISKTILDYYKRQRKICGKVVISKLVDNKCKICRTALSNANLSKVKNDGSLGTCPNCSRILIIKEQ